MITKFKDFLFEYKQLADKVYFNTDVLSSEDEELILSITKGDNYTKFISDIVFLYKNNPYYNKNSVLTELYVLIKKYDKNVFPIKGLEDINNVDKLDDVVHALRTREKVIKEFDSLPTIGKRNLRKDVREIRNYSEMNKYYNLIDYFTSQLNNFENRDEETKQKIFNKMFKNNITLDELTDFLDDKANIIGGIDITREYIMGVLSDEDYKYDTELIYEKGDVMVIKIESASAIKKLGCNSVWCFTYGKGYGNATKDWYNYSTNGMIYLIVDFSNSDNEDFMNVVIKPIDYDTEEVQYDEDEEDEHDMDEDEVNGDKIYNLMNEPQYDAISYLEQTLGLEKAEELLTFE